MKKIQLPLSVVISVVAVVGVATAAGGAIIGYGQGYKQGAIDGRYEVSRSSTSAMSQLMTGGVNIKQPDGAVKTFVLKPVEKN